MVVVTAPHLPLLLSEISVLVTSCVLFCLTVSSSAELSLLLSTGEPLCGLNLEFLNYLFLAFHSTATGIAGSSITTVAVSLSHTLAGFPSPALSIRKISTSLPGPQGSIIAYFPKTSVSVSFPLINPFSRSEFFPLIAEFFPHRFQIQPMSRPPLNPRPQHNTQLWTHK